MGKQITAKFASKCPDCGASWKEGQLIYYDKFIKNSKGKSFACTDKECALEHKLEISVSGNVQSDEPRQYGNDRFLSPSREVGAVIPDVVIGSKLVSAGDTVKSAISLAHSIAEDIYPKLPRDSQTFGQIRSKLVDQILQVYTHQPT